MCQFILAGLEDIVSSSAPAAEFGMGANKKSQGSIPGLAQNSECCVAARH